MSIHHKRSACRLCDSTNLELVFSLESSPLAEGYSLPADAHKFDARYPQDVYLCDNCSGVMQLDIVDPGVLFSNYQYESSTSPGLSEHFRKYAADVVERFKPKGGALVVDIGSNDGTLLSWFGPDEFRVVGVEPSKRLTQKAWSNSVPTYCAFMNADAGKNISTVHGAAAIITANNVLAHAEEPGVILDGVRELLDDDGVFVFEVSYLPDLIDNLVFDYCYLEHGIYPTVGAYNALLYRHGLKLFDVQRIPTKGGSIRGFAQKLCGPHKQEASVLAMIYDEGGSFNGVANPDRKYFDPITYRNFIARVNTQREITQMHLREYQSRNLRVVGYGASATTTTLLHHFQIGGMLDYLVDDNPRLHGLVSPGYHLPVKSPSELYGPNKPDAVYLCAWRFADRVIARHQRYLDEGGVFIQPLPTYKEITK